MHLGRQCQVVSAEPWQVGILNRLLHCWGSSERFRNFAKVKQLMTKQDGAQLRFHLPLPRSFQAGTCWLCPEFPPFPSCSPNNTQISGNLPWFRATCFKTMPVYCYCFSALHTMYLPQKPTYSGCSINEQVTSSHFSQSFYTWSFARHCAKSFGCIIFCSPSNNPEEMSTNWR